MQTLHPLAIAAALLCQVIIAQHIGLRPTQSLREVIGVGATIIASTLIAALIDWVLLLAVLQPFDIVYLRLFIGVILTASIAPLVEVTLRSRYVQWFPPVGNLLPLVMTTGCTLIAAQIMRLPNATFFQTVLGGLGLSVGATLLILAMQALRERKQWQSSLPSQKIVNDILHAAFILIALNGVVSIWR